MEDYTDIILLSRDLMMHKEESNTLECDKMRMKRCIEKLRQDVEYEKMNLERDKKRLKKGQQTYAKLCNAKSDLHKTFLEKERLKQTVDEDTKQLRYKITTMANQLEMEQADIQKLAMEDFHDDEFDENSSNEIILNLESTGQELILYSQDLFSLNKKIKQSAWRLKYLSCQLTPDSIACDLSSEDDEEIEMLRSCTFEHKDADTKCRYTVNEVQATADQHSAEVQAAPPSTFKTAQTDTPVIINNSTQTDVSSFSLHFDKFTETLMNGSPVATQTAASTPRASVEHKNSEDLVPSPNLRELADQVKAESARLPENAIRKFSEENPTDENRCSTPVKRSEESPSKTAARCSEDHSSKIVPRCSEDNSNIVPACPDSFSSFIESGHRATETWEDHFLECQNNNKTHNKITQTVGWRCVDELEEHPIRCVDQTKDQTCQTSRSTDQDPNQLMCQAPCTPICQSCQPMYQSFYASAPRLSPVCYTNDCSCSPSVMLYSRDCTPTYCNLTLPNQAPVRECASPPEQLGAVHSTSKAKDGDECHRDLQSDQYPTKDDNDMKMKSAPNFVHYPYLGPSHVPASYPALSQNRNPNSLEIWKQENELPNQDYPPNCTEHFFNPNLPTQDTRNCSNPTSHSIRDDSYYQVNVSPPEDCWTEIQSRFTGLLSLYTSDRMTANSDSDLDSVISTRPTFHQQPKQKSVAKSASQVMPQKKSNRAYK